MFRILVVDDDRDLNRGICSYLSMNGYEATGCLLAEDAYDALYKNMYDLIISDIMMPGTDGFAFAEAIRSQDQEIPILFLTAREDFASKKKGFKLGIDDYLVKPVDLEELVLRIEALLRRAKIANSKKLTIGELELSVDEHEACWRGEQIQLTVREFDLLYKLLSYPKKTFTRSQLMDEFWDVESASGTRTVDVYMTRIRSKFKECDVFEIVTVHGLGYKAVIADGK